MEDFKEDEEDTESKISMLYAAIAQLPPKRKNVFTLCRLEGKSYQEASDILGISIYTVKEHLIAASKAIKSYVMVQPPKNAVWLLSFIFGFLQ